MEFLVVLTDKSLQVNSVSHLIHHRRHLKLRGRLLPRLHHQVVQLLFRHELVGGRRDLISTLLQPKTAVQFCVWCQRISLKCVNLKILS